MMLSLAISLSLFGLLTVCIYLALADMLAGG